MDGTNDSPAHAHRRNLRDNRDVTRYILAILLLCWLPGVAFQGSGFN